MGLNSADVPQLDRLRTRTFVQTPWVVPLSREGGRQTRFEMAGRGCCEDREGAEEL
jgi:hypothetical protein